jgi:hypothetical protein
VKGEAKQIRVVALPTVVSHVGRHFFQSFAKSTSKFNESLGSVGIITAERCPVDLAPRLTDSNHCRTPTQTILCGSLLTPNASSEVRQRAWIPSLGFLPGAAFPTRKRTPHESENNSCWSLPRGQSENCRGSKGEYTMVPGQNPGRTRVLACRGVAPNAVTTFIGRPKRM